MIEFTPDGADQLAVPYQAPTLPYEQPLEGKNYWVIDNFFTQQEALSIANRCFNKKKWKLGKPYTKELWPGMRSGNALRPKELEKIETWVKTTLNKEKLWIAQSDKVVVDTNTAILVGAEEGSARPHVDNRNLCRYAAVLYLSVNPKPRSGTSFYRLKYANGAAGGNAVYHPFANLVDALKTTQLPISAWYEDVAIENQFNRLVLFKGNLAHSATGYFGKDKRDKRLAITFFWMTED